jgi:type IV secretory pathway TrbF-like protein
MGRIIIISFVLMIMAVALVSYIIVQAAQASVCLSCIGDKLKHKAQEIQNNPNIPEPQKTQIVTKLNDRANQLGDAIRCNPLDPRC